MLRSLAWGLSVIFHPLLIPSYMLLLLLLINPYLFGVSHLSDENSRMLLLLIFLYTFFIPAVSVAVMYMLGMVSSIEMPEQQDRIGPYLITGMLYLWVYYNFLQNGSMPPAYISFLLGTVIALFLAFFINIFTKISAHAVGMGGLLAMAIISMRYYSYGSFTLSVRHLGTYECSTLHLMLLILVLTGLVGTARLLLRAHEPQQVYGGYLVGFLAQFLALRFIF
ncbi:MAG: hypothetical protein D6772_04670 [Bacteroidetes bacterium]|nr:MAG: hypothetical protein D6772_04670 [Bacteroidota bacterium]